MYRTLFENRYFTISSYGLFLTLAFVSFYIILSYRGAKRQISSSSILTLYFIIFFSAIAGARLIYILFHAQANHGSLINAFNPFQKTGCTGVRGLSLLGGLIFALFAAAVFCLLKKISLLKLADAMAPAFGLGLFFSRIGCFLNGCCFGTPSSLPWAVSFPLPSPAALQFYRIPLHPTQLYEATGGLIIFFIILCIDRRKWPEGFLFCVLCWTYAPLRFVTDLFKYRGSIDSYSLLPSQYTSLFIFIFGFIFLAWIVFRQKKSAPEKVRSKNP
jgi:phosphatidylglycerol:prolipoprotein diacylglycerol transferase